ncbi:MAG: EAL domain-containing protein [Curvibacter sp.]|nr:MAG: EAL domain-containing protein [Curvibacter sp.]
MYVFSWYVSSALKSEMQQQLGAQQLATVTLAAEQVSQELTERLINLESVARTISPSVLRDATATQELLQNSQVLNNHFNAGVFVTLLDGTASASLPVQLGRVGVNYRDRDYIANALQLGKASVGEPVIGRRLGTPVIGMAAPIRDNQGVVMGALAGVIDLNAPSFLDHFATGKIGKTGGFLLVTPKSRLVVTATDKSRVMEQLPKVGVNTVLDRFLAGYEGWEIMKNPQGVEILAADKRIDATGWIAASMLPTAEAFAPVRAMQQRFLWGTLVLTLVAGGTVWWMLRRQLNPLFSAAQIIRDMAGGKTDIRPLPAQRADEVGALIGGVNHLIEAIDQREDALTQSVQTLHVILETTLDGFWRVNAQGALQDVNPTYCRQSGYSREELLTMTIADLEAQEQGADTQAHIGRIVKEGHDQFESTHRRKDGSIWLVEVSTVYSPSNGGEFIAFVRDITERKKAAAVLAANEKRLSAILEGAADAIFVSDAQGNYQDVNQAAVTLLGYTREEFLTKNIREVARPEELSRAQAQFDQLLATGRMRADYWLLKKSGESVPVELNATLLPDGSLFGSCRDISERLRTQEQLHLAASVFTHAREGIMITDPNGDIMEVNDTFTRITGYTRDEVLGKNPRLLSSGRQDKNFYADLWSDLETKGYWSGEVWNRRKNGEVFAEMQTISVVRDAQGKTQSYVALFSDITSLKENQHKLEHIAHFDALTNLPNRVLLADRLHQSMAQTQRRGQRLAVAYLDLDGFKSINDHHGHEAGDRLLVALSASLKHVLRDGDTLARMGGDEFVVVLVDLDDVSTSAPVLNRLLSAAAQPVLVDQALLKVSASLGVTFYPQAEEVDGEQLLRQADQAMYLAKQAGKNRYHVFDAEQDRALRGHHEGLDHIRQAMERNEFVLYYQPKVNMREGVVIGAEALIRWQHPTQGLLAPAKFLPFIEDDPLSIALGEWVIETALTQMDTWHAAGLSIPVSVNVGARQLQHPQFFVRLREVLAKHPKVKPGDLELELLETSALEDLASISKLIEDCRDIGVSFALDDFGTGYSSLTYLKRLPVALLKIDQGFVRDMLDDPDDLAILEGVIGLSQAFRRNVIAEGVETVEHGEMLLRMGCDRAQGYGIARPMPAHAMPAWKETWQPDPSWDQAKRSPRADLPLLVAQVELRAWAKAMENYLAGERLQPPVLDQHSSAFGLWLKGHGADRYPTQADFMALAPLHHQLHSMAAQLYSLRLQGEESQALMGLPGMRAVVSTLLLHLNQLIRVTRANDIA